jgi:ADP-dependent NAD(P)H-hydrate dehydratase / NAD(P)H-hydrate epimerase
MKHVDFLHPILTSEQSKAFEAQWFGSDESKELIAMNQAGAAIAKQALLDLQETLDDRALETILVLVGKGHNGGDALIATRHLLNRHPNARAKLVFPFGLSRIRPLVQRSLDDLQVAHGPQLSFLSLRKDGIDDQLDAFTQCGSVDLCLDGILGMQFRPPLRSPAKELILAINERKKIRCSIAVDVPTGVGDESDDHPFRADFTYATGIAKTGLFDLKNRTVVGRIRYLDLGFFRESQESERYVITEEALLFRRTLRQTQGHKKTFGHAFILGGSASMPGAILMTVRAALKSGVGLVTAFVPESVAAGAAVEIPEAMWVAMPEIPGNGGLALEGFAQIKQQAKKATGWIIGPGMGRHPETVALLTEVLKLSQAPVLLDADALHPELLNRIGEDRSCLITPHVGEFNRLSDRPLNTPVEEHEVLEYSRNHNCTVLLKGSPTIISQGDMAVYSCAGGPVLARGGSGDILSGLIGGRISLPGADFLSSTIEGAAWQGWAADRLARKQGQVVAKATDVLSFL